MVQVDLNALSKCGDGARALVQLIIIADRNAEEEILQYPVELRGSAETQRIMRSNHIMRAVFRIIEELA